MRLAQQALDLETVAQHEADNVGVRQAAELLFQAVERAVLGAGEVGFARDTPRTGKVFVGHRRGWATRGPHIAYKIRHMAGSCNLADTNHYAPFPLSDFDSQVSAAPDPLATFSADDLSAAFANASTGAYSGPPAETDVADAAAAPPAPVADAAPATNETAAPAPEAPAPDYAAYLRDTFGADTPDTIKSAMQTAREADTLRANQRTSEDVALRALLEDPAKAQQFFSLQHTDFKTLPARELLAAKYAHDHPELPAELAALEADMEYDAKYAAAEFDDPDDPQVRTAKLRLSYAEQAARTTMEQAKADAKTAVLRPNTPEKAEGLSEEEKVRQNEFWMKGVEGITGAGALDLSYDVDGTEVKLSFDNKNAAFQQAMLSPMEWLANEVQPGADPAATNYDRLAEIVALATQAPTLVKNAFAAGKASLGAVIPLSRAVNPAPAAPQGPVSGGMDLAEAMRQASMRPAGNQY